MSNFNQLNGAFYQIANSDPNGNITGLTIDSFTSNSANLGPIANVKISGGVAGYVIATDGTGNLSFVAQSGGGGGGGASIANGSSSVDIATFNGNAVVTIGGSTVGNFTSNGLQISNVTANVVGANTGNVININSNLVTANNSVLTNANITTANVTTLNTGTIQNSGIGNVTINDEVYITGNIQTAVTSNISGVNGLNVNTGSFNNINTGNLQTGNITATGFAINFNGKVLSSVGTPTSSNHAATKGYVDTFVQGISVKTAANTSTQTSLASSSGGSITYNNGTSGVGATLVTSTSWGTIGGLAVTVGQRVLVKDETNSAHNGIYVITNSTTMTRATDADTPSKINAGVFVFIESGNLDATGWVQVEVVTTIGTDPITFNQFAGAGTYDAGTGLTLVGTTFSVDQTQNFTGNVAAANYTTSGTIAADGNITGANLIANNNIVASGNATITGNVTAVGNVNGAAVNGGNVTATVQVSAPTLVATSDANVANINVSNIANLGPVANVKITGGISNQYLRTDGSGTLTWANAVSNVAVTSGNGISVTGSPITTTGTINVTNTGMISQNGQTYNDTTNEVWVWDSNNGRGPWINYTNATAENDADFAMRGWMLCPNSNSSRGSIVTQVANLSTYFNKFGDDVMFTAYVGINGTADAVGITFGSNTSNSATADTSVGSRDPVGISVFADIFNYKISIAKAGTLYVYPWTWEAALRGSTSAAMTTWKKLQVLVRYINASSTLVYVFWEDKFMTVTDVGAWTPGTGNYMYLNAYTGGASAEFRCRRVVIESGNFAKYLHLANYPQTTTFNFTGSDTTFTVPAGVNSINFTVRGAQGGSRILGGVGGLGAQLEGVLPVTPGEALTISVGGSGYFANRDGGFPDGGAGGNNTANSSAYGCGGGGSSGIYRGSRSQANAVVVAAGGGGCVAGLGSGTQSGGNAVVAYAAWYNVSNQWGGNAGIQATAGSFGNVGGRGATMTANVYNGGGAAGVPFDPNTVNPTAGAALSGGTGGFTNAGGHRAGGGGGGGYWGGGGGAAGGSAGAGGGAGASYSTVPWKVNKSDNLGTGNGQIILRYRGQPR